MNSTSLLFSLPKRLLQRWISKGAPAPARVGVSMPTRTNVRWIEEGNSLVTHLSAKGYLVDLQYAENDVMKQIAQIRNMVAQGASALVITAIDNIALSSILQMAATKGIKVLAYDRLLLETDHVDFYISYDSFLAGALQAHALERALELPHAQGPFNIEIFGGPLDDHNSHIFYAGAMSVLQPYLDRKQIIVPSQETLLEDVSTTRWYAALAVSRLISLLNTRYQDKRLHALLSPLDGISIGLLGALKAMGYGTAHRPLPFVTGQDAEIQSIKSILAGEQHSTVFKDPRALALLAANTIAQLLAGQMPAHDVHQAMHNRVKSVPTLLLDPALVDASNVYTVLVDSGFLRPENLV